MLTADLRATHIDLAHFSLGTTTAPEAPPAPVKTPEPPAREAPLPAPPPLERPAHKPQCPPQVDPDKKFSTCQL